MRRRATKRANDNKGQRAAETAEAYDVCRVLSARQVSGRCALDRNGGVVKTATENTQTCKLNLGNKDGHEAG